MLNLCLNLNESQPLEAYLGKYPEDKQHLVDIKTGNGTGLIIHNKR